MTRGTSLITLWQGGLLWSHSDKGDYYDLTLPNFDKGDYSDNWDYSDSILWQRGLLHYSDHILTRGATLITFWQGGLLWPHSVKGDYSDHTLTRGTTIQADSWELVNDITLISLWAVGTIDVKPWRNILEIKHVKPFFRSNEIQTP